MNKVNLIGRLTNSLQLEKVKDVNASKFGLAVNDKFNKDRVDFVNCEVWGKTASILKEHTNKGMLVGISGRLKVESYQDKSGNRRQSARVVVEDFTLIQYKQELQAEKQTETNYTQEIDVPIDKFIKNEIEEEDLPW